MSRKQHKPREPRQSATMYIEVSRAVADTFMKFCTDRKLHPDDVLRIMLKGYQARDVVKTPSNVMSFGKYNGETIATVIRLDPGYILWALKNVDLFRLNDEALDILNEQIAE